MSDLSEDENVPTETANDATTETLMPLEAVAKAIFVDANGIAAYEQVTGLGRKD